MRLHVWLSVHMYAYACVYSTSHLQAIRRYQHLGECTDLTEHCAFWEREHLAEITMLHLALRTALWSVAAITMTCRDDSSLASVNGLKEDRIQAGVKHLHHKLKRFAVWTVFHLKLAQYIFNEFFYKTFNSPQFISSGKWLSNLKWWTECCLYIHYLRRKSDFFKKNVLSSLCSHSSDVKTLMSASPLWLKDVILQETCCNIFYHEELWYILGYTLGNIFVIIYHHTLMTSNYTFHLRIQQVFLAIYFAESFFRCCGKYKGKSGKDTRLKMLWHTGSPIRY